MNIASARTSIFSFIAGAVTVLAFAPFNFYPISVIALALLFFIWSQGTLKQAFSTGYFYGLGLMLFGVFWLHVSISKFGGVPLPAAIFLAVVFAFFMALFFAVAGWSAAWFGKRFDLSVGLQLLLVFPAVWVLVEWLRGLFLTGFPWLSLGYSQLDTSLSAYAPVLGVFGVSWFVALSAGLLVLLVTSNKKSRVYALLALVLLWATGLLLSSVVWITPQGEKKSVVLVQGNIPQELKWQPALLEHTLSLYESLSFEQHADFIIWPETAVPSFADRVEQEFLQPLNKRVKSAGSELVLGIPVRDDKQHYYNSLLSFGSQNDRYDKRHLVPFGEFMPLDALLRPVLDFLKIPMSNFSSGTASRPLLKVGEYHAAVSICYEDAFGDETIQALPQAAFLINASNDAWFGDSLAPYQHLQIARMRALETGRYLLRATNTGVSAIVDPNGKIQAQTTLLQQAVLRGTFIPMAGQTPYVMWGNAAIILLALLSLLAAFVLSRFVSLRH